VALLIGLNPLDAEKASTLWGREPHHLAHNLFCTGGTVKGKKLYLNKPKI